MLQQHQQQQNNQNDEILLKIEIEKKIMLISNGTWAYHLFGAWVSFADIILGKKRKKKEEVFVREKKQIC